MGNYRGRPPLIEDFGSLEHVVEDRGLTKAGFVELIAIQIDTALADVVIADLYPVGLRGIHIAEEVVAGTLEILVLFVAVTTSRAASARYWVSVPMPGPISRTKSSLVISAAAMILSSTWGSMRKFWPNFF